MFPKGPVRPEAHVDFIEGESRCVGPETYSPRIDAILKVGNSKSMIPRNFPPERKVEPDEPGPDHYNLPD